MLPIGQRKDRIGVARIERELRQNAVFDAALGAKERTDLRPVRRVPGVSGNEGRDGAVAAR